MGWSHWNNIFENLYGSLEFIYECRDWKMIYFLILIKEKSLLWKGQPHKSYVHVLPFVNLKVNKQIINA